MFENKINTAVFAALVLLGVTPLQVHAADDAASEADFIRGLVTGETGPEAGVWVIAQTEDLATPFAKVVVTDDEGRYVLPQLPQASYRIWVRGYGLQDSEPVAGAPGQNVDIAVSNAPDAQTAAQVYPANYWSSLIEVPDESEFPGTGPNGNGISPAFEIQEHWLLNLKSRCASCHQLGNQVTREILLDDPIEAWEQKINMERDPGDITLSNSGRDYKNTMVNGMTSFGGERAYQMFADWSVAILNGAVPTSPPRPKGLERNVVLTMWDWADERAVHDEVTTDQRNPTVNAYGPVYGAIGLYNEEPRFGALSVLDPVSHEANLIPANRLDPESVSAPPSGIEWALHTPMLDQKGRVWTTSVTTEPTPSPIDCFDPDNKYAAYYPIDNARYPQDTSTKYVSLYDPETGEERPIPVCYMTHHLRFAYDEDNTLFFSSIQTRDAIGWLNTRVYDETQDPMKAIGWCPLVLDTSGDGKIDPDRAMWKQLTGGLRGASEGRNDSLDDVNRNENVSAEGGDTQYTFGSYSISVSQVDGSIWFGAPSSPHPGGIGRLSLGKNPPETCVTEYYQPPKNSDGTSSAFFDQGMDLDSKGIAWAAFSSGHLGKFDRSKCRVTNGPTATGQQCPEGWTIYETPGPKLADTDTSGDFHYLIFVDIHNTLGLGEDVPIVTGTNSDSLLAFLPDKEEWVVMRRPYPLGFYARGLDGRIDDPDAGWKGRAIWSADEMIPIFQLETGLFSTGKVVKFQMRPDPLAH